MTVLQRFLPRYARSAAHTRRPAAARRLTGTPPDRRRVISTVLRGACVAAAMLVWAAPAHAQRYFGMNQVEYRHFRWRVIETEHFLIHYYPEEKVPAYDAARAAFTEAWDGTEPVDMGVGGSIPFIAEFLEAMPGASVLVTGVEDPDTRAHGPNEGLHLAEFEKVLLAEALLLRNLG